MPEPGRQRVVGLIGCPGAGKTPYVHRFDPLEGWVHLTLDDFRQALWPPDRQVIGRCDARAGTGRPTISFIRFKSPLSTPP